MTNRKVIYNKNFEGSPFRTIGGTGLSGGKKSKSKRGITLPKFVQIFPGVFVANAPAAVQTWRKSQGFANLSDWNREMQSAKLPAFTVLKPLIGWNPPSWSEFWFEGTIFDKDFWKPYKEILIDNPTTGKPGDYYWEVAKRNGNIANTPPPNFGGVGGDIRDELWDMFNSPTYWDLDPTND